MMSKTDETFQRAHTSFLNFLSYIVFVDLFVFIAYQISMSACFIFSNLCHNSSLETTGPTKLYSSGWHHHKVVGIWIYSSCSNHNLVLYYLNVTYKIRLITWFVLAWATQKLPQVKQDLLLLLSTHQISGGFSVAQSSFVNCRILPASVVLSYCCVIFFFHLEKN